MGNKVFELKLSIIREAVVLQQPTGQGLGYMALTGQPGHFGQEINDSCLDDYHPALADGDCQSAERRHRVR